MTPTRAGVTALTAVLGAVAVLAMVTWGAATGPDRLFRADGRPVSSSQVHPDASPPPTGLDLAGRLQREHTLHQQVAPLWVRLAGGVLEVAVGGAVLVLLWRLAGGLLQRWRDRVRPTRRAQEPVDTDVLDDGPALAAAVGADVGEQYAALQGGEPRNAIVACWHRFETAADHAGVRRLLWQTPSEFVLDVLDRAGADPSAAVELADLYREARFSEHPVTEDHRGRALAALEATHRSLQTAATTGSAR